MAAMGAGEDIAHPIVLDTHCRISASVFLFGAAQQNHDKQHHRRQQRTPEAGCIMLRRYRGGIQSGGWAAAGRRGGAGCPHTHEPGGTDTPGGKKVFSRSHQPPKWRCGTHDRCAATVSTESGLWMATRVQKLGANTAACCDRCARSQA